MDKGILNAIKQKALEEHIPIIMDDTLETIKKYIANCKLNSILEIGTAVRIFCNMFHTIFSRKWTNRYNRKRNRKSKRSKRKYKKSRSRKIHKHI